MPQPMQQIPIQEIQPIPMQPIPFRPRPRPRNIFAQPPIHNLISANTNTERENFIAPTSQPQRNISEFITGRMNRRYYGMSTGDIICKIILGRRNL